MTTIPDFTITKLTVIDAPVNLAGNRLLAVFDLILCGMRICSCVLTEKDTGVVKAAGPLGKTHRGHDIRVSFEDPAIARAITRKAAEAYGVLTGRELSDD
ncbi:hypothetical protein [Paracoccus hibiscisoli]|uniref:hypothetical protein n=1 Tax=Paracoccus hibiscisoli TaxID=2023261 RepID=UPI0023EFA554|nr:hypothetical protein [Paracoccus hibiscisoli]